MASEYMESCSTLDAVRMQIITTYLPQWPKSNALHAWNCHRQEATGAFVLCCGNEKQLNHNGRQIGHFLEDKTCRYQAHYNTLPNIYPMELKP